MPDHSTRLTDIDSLQNRIAILEDLVTFHIQLGAECADRLLGVAAVLGSEDTATASVEALRTIVGITRLGLTLLAQENTRAKRDTEATLATLSYSSLMAQHSILPS